MARATSPATRHTNWLHTLFIVLSLLAIAASEWAFVYSDISYGIVAALCTTVGIYLVVSLARMPQGVADCAESLALVPLYILLTASLPWFFVNRTLILPAVYAVVLGLCLWHIYSKKLPFTEVGLRHERWARYSVIGAVVAIPLGITEFYVLGLKPSFPVFNLSYLLRDLFYMLFFVGLGEEVLFRGIIQRNLMNAFGTGWGLFLASALFSIMHLGWHSVPELGFTFAIALLLGYLYWRSGSLVGPIVIHGVANTVLVAVMPYI
ncbi:MAG: CPBP family intramembrane glutamic endopeptidase [Chloroflexota bacterium]